MLSALLDADVEFLLVGAHALASHGYLRATEDMGIWVRPARDNAQRLWRAWEQFGAPLRDAVEEDFLSPSLVFQIGVPPGRIDIITSIEGVAFPEAWQRREYRTVWGLEVPVLAIEDLIRNKEATGRKRDAADLEQLRLIERATRPRNQKR